MLTTDQLIKTFKEDLLGRYNYSSSLAKAILGYEHIGSIVLGLYGEWGSGKTSIINMTTEYINSITKGDSYKPIIMKFNPWNYSNQNQLISEFLG